MRGNTLNPTETFKKMKCSEKHLDRLWPVVIKNIAKGECQHCGGIGQHAHHIINRWHKSTRWHIANGCFLCAYCHGLYHKLPDLSKQYFIARHGEGAYNDLVALSNEVWRGNKETVEAILRRFL